MKHQKAIELLMTELSRLGGIVFARYLIKQNKEAEQTLYAMEFLGKLMEGNLEKDDEKYLERYLKPMYEINAAINKLQEK